MHINVDEIDDGAGDEHLAADRGVRQRGADNRHHTGRGGRIALTDVDAGADADA